MARFAENRFRCAIDPGKKSEAFKDLLNSSNTLIAFKDAWCALEFALFNGSVLYDITNIASISLLVTNANGAAAFPVKTLTAAQLNPALTLNADDVRNWNNSEEGDEHGVFEISQEEAAFAAGTYEVTVFGLTSTDGVLKRAVFGTSKLKVIDRKITNFLAAPVPGVQYATLDDVKGLTEQCVRYGPNPKGKTVTFVGPAGLKGTVIGAGDEGEFVNFPVDI